MYSEDIMVHNTTCNTYNPEAKEASIFLIPSLKKRKLNKQKINKTGMFLCDKLVHPFRLNDVWILLMKYRQENVRKDETTT